jgi:hypothetical protein
LAHAKQQKTKTSSVNMACFAEEEDEGQGTNKFSLWFLLFFGAVIA